MDINELVRLYIKGKIDIKKLEGTLACFINNLERELVLEIVSSWDQEEDFLKFMKRYLQNLKRKQTYKNKQRLVDDYLEYCFNYKVNSAGELLGECDKFLTFAESKGVSIYKALVRGLGKSEEFKKLVDKYFLNDISSFKQMILDDNYKLWRLADVLLRLENFKIDNALNEELVKRYQAGEEELLEQIIDNNRDLVNTCVSRVLRKKEVQCLTEEDLIQEGLIALIKAARNYDMTMELGFSYYAFKAVKNGILRAIRNYDKMVRLPTYMEENLSLIFKEMKKRENQGLKVNVRELMEEMGYNSDVYQRALYFWERMGSLNEIIRIEGEADTLINIVRGREDVFLECIKRETKEEIEELLACLTAKQLRVVTLFYEGEFRQREIAQMLETSDANIYCYLKLAHKRMERYINKNQARYRGRLVEYE